MDDFARKIHNPVIVIDSEWESNAWNLLLKCSKWGKHFNYIILHFSPESWTNSKNKADLKKFKIF